MGVEYIPENQSIRVSQVLPTQEKFVELGEDEIMAVVTKEHLVFTCKTCGYKEAEKVKK